MHAFIWPFSKSCLFTLLLGRSVSFFLFLWNGVCVDPLHGEVADGSMGSRKSAPVLVSSAPQSSDNWIIILPVCPLFSALVSLSVFFFPLKVCAVYGFNFCQITPGPSDGTIRCLWSKHVLCSILHDSGKACVFHLLLSWHDWGVSQLFFSIHLFIHGPLRPGRSFPPLLYI